VQPLPRIGPFQERRLEAFLTENDVRPRRERLRMTRIHDLLRREGFDGSYDAVRRYAERWLRERRKERWCRGVYPADVTAPSVQCLRLRPGEAYQFHWSHANPATLYPSARGHLADAVSERC
jgi:hypothetical protein